MARSFCISRMFAAAVALAIVGGGVFSASAMAGSVVVYDIGDNVGPFGTPLSSDGWTGDDIDDWEVASFTGDLYARNTDDGDDLITRPNDLSFAVDIPSNALNVSVEVVARVNGNFWEVGLADGGSRVLGVGADFSNSLKYFILDAFSRINEGGTSVSGDALHTVEVDFDVVAGTADLILDGSTLIDDATLTNVNAASLANVDELFIRTASRFVGPASFTISVVAIPEPSTFALSATGMMALVGFRRRRRASRTVA